MFNYRDRGIYMVELYHDCNSTAEAREFKVVIHMPDYADYVSADWVNNTGRVAFDEDHRADSIQFSFHRRALFEIYQIVFDASSLLFKSYDGRGLIRSYDGSPNDESLILKFIFCFA